MDFQIYSALHTLYNINHIWYPKIFNYIKKPLILTLCTTWSHSISDIMDNAHGHWGLFLRPWNYGKFHWGEFVLPLQRADLKRFLGDGWVGGRVGQLDGDVRVWLWAAGGSMVGCPSWKGLQRPQQLARGRARRGTRSRLCSAGSGEARGGWGAAPIHEGPAGSGALPPRSHFTQRNISFQRVIWPLKQILGDFVGKHWKHMQIAHIW